MLTRVAKEAPYITTVLVFAAIGFGLFMLLRAPLQLLPEVNPPTASVEISWRDADARSIESEILNPVQTELFGMPGLKKLSATASRGQAFFDLRFGMDTDMQTAQIDLVSRINRVRGLPPSADPPVINFWGGRGFAGNPLTTLSYVYITHDETADTAIAELEEYIENFVVPQFGALPGISRVYVNRTARNELNIQIDLDKMVNLGVSIDDLNQIGNAKDVFAEGLDFDDKLYSLHFEGLYDTDNLSERIIHWHNGQPVYLGDIADIEVRPGKKTRAAFFNGKPAIALRLDKDPETNVLVSFAEIRDLLSQLNNEDFSKRNLRAEISFDPTLFVYRALNTIAINLLIAFLSTVAVVYLFFQDLRFVRTLVVVVPVSIVSSVGFMILLDRSINVISLAGIAIAVGVVVDAAICVTENIVRLRREGHSDADLEGTRSVQPALIASALTTIIVFLPILFLPGVEGQLFSDMALILSISVCVSTVLAVTVVPLMTSEVSDRHATKNRLTLNNFVHSTLTRILPLLTATSSRRVVVYGVPVVALSVSFALAPDLDYLPSVKRDALSTYIRMPPGQSFNSINSNVLTHVNEELSKYIDSDGELPIRNFYLIAFGPEDASLGIRMADQNTVPALEQYIRRDLFSNHGEVKPFPFRTNLFGDYSGGRDIWLILQSDDDATRSMLSNKALNLIDQHLPHAQVRTNPNLEARDSQLLLTPVDHMIRQAGWSRKSLGNVIAAFGSGLFIGEYLDGNDRMDMIISAAPPGKPVDLKQTSLVAPTGEVYLLSELLKQVEVSRNPYVFHYNRTRSQVLMITPSPDMALAKTLSHLEQYVVPELKSSLPTGAAVMLEGQAAEFRDSLRNTGVMFIASIIALLLVLSATFRSLPYALMVLLAVPISTTGGIIGLWFLGLFTTQNLDLLTLLGFLVLFGLSVNNSVLLLKTFDALLDESSNPRHAITEALRQRARPIFMTTLTSIAAMLPILLFQGSGSEMYRGLAMVIVSGMAFSLAYSLLYLPSAALEFSKREDLCLRNV